MLDTVPYSCVYLYLISSCISCPTTNSLPPSPIPLNPPQPQVYPTSNAMFTTPRLTLRAFRDGDDENMLSITNNASAAPFITVDYVVPRGPKQKQVIAEMAANSMMFCIIEERLPEDSTNPGTQQNITAASPKFIGAVAFMNKPDARNRRGEFGISMLPEFWGKGYGEEASRFMIGYGFRQLGLHRVSLGVFEWNTRAVELYKRL
ncbi:acyl-CoA N-acyltransferase [Crucibulum laeve]|uniref:Acyl-CoA N-acyltransferase n=1 Tax=Crucibulum laeve TaxID=68775 RepID=A0A5C3M6S1_9AGAR|nr:acyl-CoA N-acyltransferase [Crucibulum laeve]